MENPPSPNERFMNTQNDELVIFLAHEDGKYLFSRPADGTLSIPTELWFDTDVDWFESQGVRP